MKNEIKILIAAIVVILIVLVGAYALSGSNNPQPSATPTVMPATATPTTVPGGPGSTVSVTPAPSVAPTVTPVPSVTATPVPENGVKQTEFGYWITYPPLDPQTWSNPKPIPSSGNIVYFEPAYGVLYPHDSKYESLESGDTWYEAYLYREGNMSENVTVTIHMTYSSNIVYGKDIKSVLVVPADYMVSAHGDDSDIFTDLGDGYYEVTFEPGVSAQYVCIHVNPLYEDVGMAAEGIPDGWVRLTLTGANSGFSVDGARNNFLLDINELPVVTFDPEAWGGLWDNEGVVGFNGDIDNAYVSDDKVYATLPIYRSNSAGTLTVDLGWELDYNSPGAPIMPDSALTIQPFTFADGQSDGLVTIVIDSDYIFDYSSYEYDLYVYIDESDDYMVDWHEFNILTNGLK